MAYLRAYEVQQLLHNKFVVILGDSIQRAVYKDLVLLLQKDRLLTTSQLKAKGELSFERDVLLEGGRWGPMHNGYHYREVRQFRTGHHLVRFYFLTGAYSSYVEDVLAELRWGEHSPDVVVMNSCLWDVSRYGRNFQRHYREDLECLFGRLLQVLPASCLLLWSTAMPVAEVVRGGFLSAACRSQGARLRKDVMEANFYSSTEASRFGLDVLDLHFHFRHAGRHRQRDGVHWDQQAHRRLSQLLLQHLADAWGVELPRRERPRGDSWGCGHRDSWGCGHRDSWGCGHRAEPAGRRSSRYRRQPQERRGDPGGHVLRRPPPSSSSHRAAAGPPRPCAPYPLRRPPLPPAPRSVHGPYCPRSQRNHFSCRTSPQRVRHTYHTDRGSTMGPEPRLGPIRTYQHLSRGAPPYPNWRPGGSRRHRERRTSRGPEHALRRGPSSQP